MTFTKGKGSKLTRLCFSTFLGILTLFLVGCGSPTAIPQAPISTEPPAAATFTPVPPTPVPPTPTNPPATATLPVPTATEEQLPTLETQSNGCPVGTADAEPYTNNQDGYCLLVPNGFSINQPTEGLLVITGPALDQSIEPVQAMLTISRIGSSGGRMLTDIAQEAWSGAREEFTQNTITLGGDTALMAEGLLIGEAEWKIKEVMVIHEGMTYKLTFTPVDEGDGFAAALPDIQKLWDNVFASFAFLF